jgi:hypothetical protein
MTFGSPADVGQPARTVWEVISEDSSSAASASGDEEVTTLHQSPAGRVQVKARVIRDQGRVREIRFEKIRGAAGQDATVESILNLDEEASTRLIELCVALLGVDPAGDETLKLDGDVLSRLLENPQALLAAYGRDPERFAAVVESDVSARDIIAIAARRATLERFEALLRDPAKFEGARAGGSREAVWQRFFEEHSWLLGVGLGGQLLTAWDDTHLERVVAGFSIADVGKRADAVMTTASAAGLVRSLVFAEIKLHDDALLDAREYRSGTWAPSIAVTGGVAQSLITVDRARDDLGTWLEKKDPEGFPTGEQVYAGAPRSFLIVGDLESLTRDGRVHPDKVRSFELYRRTVAHPEIVTYDEVLARARWALQLLEATTANSGAPGTSDKPES